jgi:hypothetical protein
LRIGSAPAPLLVEGQLTGEAQATGRDRKHEDSYCPVIVRPAHLYLGRVSRRFAGTIIMMADTATAKAAGFPARRTFDLDQWLNGNLALSLKFTHRVGSTSLNCALQLRVSDHINKCLSQAEKARRRLRYLLTRSIARARLDLAAMSKNGTANNE